MSLKNRKVIITGGPTREWLDPVRFISNPSSGKMGISISDEALKRAREIVFIHGPIDGRLLEKKKFRTVSVESTTDMLNAVMDELEDNAVVIMSAAPADYTAAEMSPEKMKKGDGELSLKLKRTPDILKNISAARDEGKFSNLFVVGFAAETTNIEEYAREKLVSKKLEMICLNDVSRDDAGFGTDTNIITIFKKNGSTVKLPKLTKNGLAEKIFDQIQFEVSQEG